MTANLFADIPSTVQTSEPTTEIQLEDDIVKQSSTTPSITNMSLVQLEDDIVNQQLVNAR